MALTSKGQKVYVYAFQWYVKFNFMKSKSTNGKKWENVDLERVEHASSAKGVDSLHQDEVTH